VNLLVSVLPCGGMRHRHQRSAARGIEEGLWLGFVAGAGTALASALLDFLPEGVRGLSFCDPAIYEYPRKIRLCDQKHLQRCLYIMTWATIMRAAGVVIRKF
jgi:hypothetical protein